MKSDMKNLDFKEVSELIRYCFIQRGPLRWIILVISFLNLLVGCVYNEEISPEQKLQSWKGKEITELFQTDKWGYPPDELLKEEGVLIYVYYKSHLQTMTVSNYEIRAGERGCRIGFIVKEGVITGFRVQNATQCKL